MNLFDLVATLRLDSTQYENAVKGADEKGRGILGTGLTKLKALGIGVFAGLTASAVKFGKDTIATGMEFDKAISQVAATMGKTTEEFNAIQVSTDEFTGSLRDLAIEMGSKTAFTATQAGEALNYMALAGYDAQKSAEMLPRVLSLASAGNMDLAKASDMVTDAQSALGLSTEETNAMIDQMAKASSKSNTSVEQLGEAILTVGGTAKGLKGSTTELSTALGILADNGTKGAEGGTALRNVLLGIQGKKFEKTFGAMGVSAYDAEGNMRSLKDVFLDMEQAMDGMTQQERDKIITSTFNARDLKNINALLGTTAKRWDELTEAIDDSAGSAEQMAQTQLDNLAGDVTILQSAWEGLQITLSDKVAPAFRGVVQFGTNVVSSLSDAFKNGIDLSGIADRVTEGLNNVLPRITEFTGKIREKAGQFISNGLEIVKNIAKGIANGIPALVQNIPTIISNIAGIINDNAPKILATGFSIIVTLAKGLVNAIPVIVENLPKIVGAIWDFFTAINWLSLGKTAITGIGKGIKSMVKYIRNNGKEIATNAWNAIKGGWKNIGQLGVDAIRAVIRGLANVGKSLLTKAKSLATSAKEAIKKGFLGMAGIGANIVTGLWNGISDKARWLKDMISGWIGDVKGFLKNLFGIASPSKWARYTIGRNIPLGVARGIEDEADSVQDSFDSIIPDYNADDFVFDVPNGNGRGLGGGVSIVNYITVDGAENPEDFTDRFVRRLRMDMRMV